MWYSFFFFGSRTIFFEIFTWFFHTPSGHHGRMKRITLELARVGMHDQVSIHAPAGGATRLFYCALDDLDANLQPLPFYAKPIVQQDPSGVKIVGTSKPLPAPVLGAIVWQQVLP